MTFQQLAERPISILSDTPKSFQGFFMVDKKSRVNTGDSAIGNIRFEEAATWCGIFYVADRRTTHNSSAPITD